MIYGEGGTEAFIRLQKAIMEQSDDHSLFAWEMECGPPGHGLLATSPALFRSSAPFIRVQRPGARTAYRMTNRGLEIQLNLTCTLRGGDHIALLGCLDSEDGSTVGVYVIIMEDGRFIRTRLSQLARIRSPPDSGHKLLVLETIYIPQMYMQKLPAQREFKFLVDYSQHRTYGSAIGSPAKRAGLALWSSIMSSMAPARGHIDSRGILTPAAITSPGRSGYGDTLHFTLAVEGRAGIILFPANNIVSYLTLKGFSFLAVIFGVNRDNSVYADIIEGDREDMEELHHGSLDLVNRYILQCRVDSSSKSATMRVLEKFILSVELKPKSVEGKLVYEVCIS
jgi:hypothetical protein